MNKFSAQQWINIGHSMATIDQWGAGEGSMTKFKLESTRDFFHELAGDLTAIGCKLSANRARDMGYDGFRELSFEVWKIRLSDLRSLIYDEMKLHLFLWVPPERALAYSQDRPFFGEEVESHFPSTEYDVEESGKCFACGRFTAAVIHSMRVLESGLTAVGAKIGLPRGDRGWGPDLKIFKKRWGEISQGAIQFQIDGGAQSWDQFFSEAFSDFRHFAGAWRNDAVHDPSTKYTEEEAQRIIERVRSFMQHLAKRLTEQLQP